MLGLFSNSLQSIQNYSIMQSKMETIYLNSSLFTQNDNYKEFIALAEGDYNVTSRNCWRFRIYW
ncbi:MAG: hypothetical protein QG641_2354 [Candidatus Poribacteria bacterium]|nr:hypothetical protein [Candidatus Poribacteria bacterium]